MTRFHYTLPNYPLLRAAFRLADPLELLWLYPFIVVSSHAGRDKLPAAGAHVAHYMHQIPRNQRQWHVDAVTTIRQKFTCPQYGRLRAATAQIVQEVSHA